MGTATAESVQGSRPVGQFEVVHYRIRGLSPLLQNNPAAFIGAAEAEGLTSRKKDYDDAQEAALRTYVDPLGQYYHPCEAFRRAMHEAVKGKKFGKMAATRALRGAVIIVQPYAVILGPDGEPAKEYQIDRRPVVVGSARVLRCRPCWPEWQMLVPLQIDRAMLSPENVLEMLTLAGLMVGIGDYRPEKGGGFGRFTCEIDAAE